MTHYKNNIFNLVNMAEVGFYEDFEFVNRIKQDMELWLLREPENPNNTNAVSVHACGVIGKIGYIPSEQGKKLAPILDRGSHYECFINNKHGNARSPEITIKLTTYPIKRLTQQNPRIQTGQRRPVETVDHESPTKKKFKRVHNFELWAKEHDGIKGIYVIWNYKKKYYVGKSDNLGRRWREHRADLFRKKHVNQELQKDWIDMGADAFRFDILEEIDSQDDFGDKEELYIKLLNSYFRGYNQTPHGGQIENYKKIQTHGKDIHGTTDEVQQFIYVDPNEALIRPPGKKNSAATYQSPIGSNQTGLAREPKVHGTLQSIEKKESKIEQVADSLTAILSPAPKQSPPSKQIPPPDPEPIRPDEPIKLWIPMWVFIIIFIWLILSIIYGGDREYITRNQGDTVYEVQRGDTLSKIAKKHGVDVKKIIDANNIENIDLIEPGEKIHMPL